jgi:hypothetical protein
MVNVIDAAGERLDMTEELQKIPVNNIYMNVIKIKLILNHIK